MKLFFKIITIFPVLIFLTNCTSTKKKSVHGEGPLIDPSQIVIDGDKSMQDKVKYGPKPYDTEFDPTANKRKTITTEQVRNYVTIDEEYTNLKQLVSSTEKGCSRQGAGHPLRSVRSEMGRGVRASHHRSSGQPTRPRRSSCSHGWSRQ